MIYYVPLLIIYAICGAVELNHSQIRKPRRLYIIIMLFPLFCLTAFRDVSIGNDTITYSDMYNTVSQADNLIEAWLISVMENGYVTFCYICSLIGMSFFQFQILFSSFIFVAFGIFIYKFSVNIGLTCFLFVSAGCMSGAMNIMRSYGAVAVLLFAIPYILHKQFWRFLFLVLLAGSFHKTALTFLIMYPLCVRKYDRKAITFFIIGSVVLLYFSSLFFKWITSRLGVYQGYLDSEYFGNTNMLGVLVELFIVSFVAFFSYSMGYFKVKQFECSVNKEKVITIDYYNKMSLLVTFCLSIIGLSNTIMGRISLYYNVIFIILIPSILIAKSDRIYRMFVFDLIVFLYGAYFIIIRLFRPEWNMITPYVWGF